MSMSPSPSPSGSDYLSPSPESRPSSSKNKRKASSKSSSSASANETGPLRRGSACLACRKRKLKCDAGKPVCKQCMRANKPGQCSYDNSNALSRTQLLQRRISQLEQKLTELQTQGSRPSTSSSRSTSPPLPQAESESFSWQASTSNSSFDDSFIPGLDHPLSGVPPLTFDSLHGSRSSTSSSSVSEESNDLMFPTPTQDTSWIAGTNDFTFEPTSLGDLGNPGTSADLSLYLQPSAPGTVQPIPNVTVSDPTTPTKSSNEESSTQMERRRFLLDIFLPRRQLCHFDIHVGRFLASLESPSSKKRPHPCLLDAMCLMACHLSRSPELSAYESEFLSRARQGLVDALENADRILNFIQASSLVAQYLWAKGRFIEAYHQTCQVARFAISCGLHQISSPVWREPRQDGQSNSRSSGSEESTAKKTAPAWTMTNMAVRRGSMLDAPKDAIELGERIMAFWHVFLLDRCGSVITNLPAALPDECDPFSQIETVWPRSLHEFELGIVSDMDYGTVSSLYDEDAMLPLGRMDTIFTLQLKSSILFERACRFSQKASRPITEWTTFRTIDIAISRFAKIIPGIRNSGEMGEVIGGLSDPVNPQLVIVHTLTITAMLELHNSVAMDVPESYERCLRAARDVVAIARDMGDVDLTEFEMLLGHSWKCVADVLIRQLHRQVHSPDLHELTLLESDLSTLLYQLKRLEHVFPLLSLQVAEIEQARNLLTLAPFS